MLASTTFPATPILELYFNGGNWVSGEAISGSVDCVLPSGFTWASPGTTGQYYAGRNNSAAATTPEGTWTIVAGTPPYTYWNGAGADANMLTAGNWINGLPASGAELSFGTLGGGANHAE